MALSQNRKFCNHSACVVNNLSMCNVCKLVNRNVLKDITNNSSKTCSKTILNKKISVSSGSSTTTMSQNDYEIVSADKLKKQVYLNGPCTNTSNCQDNFKSLNVEYNYLRNRQKKYSENQYSNKNEEGTEIYTDSSENLLERKYTQVFHQNKNSPRKSKNHKTPQRARNSYKDQENSTSKDKSKEIRLILKTLKKIFHSPSVALKENKDLKEFHESIRTLQVDQQQLSMIIKKQQDQLSDFQSKYVDAQTTIQSQKNEVNKLFSENKRLEKELNLTNETLRTEIQNKKLQRNVKPEKSELEKLTNENCILKTKLQEVRQENIFNRAKLEDMAQKKTNILNKLKTTQRDLKIFRNQNNIFKTEKRDLFEELKKLKNANESLKANSSKSITRQKELVESQQRLLRKKIIDLELELNQSRNSACAIVEEREGLIEELRIQLNTLVHNFEISQKHIRTLRKHIYTLGGKPNREVDKSFQTLNLR